MKSRSCGNGSGEAAGPAAEMISVDSWKGGHMGEKDMAEKLLEDYPDVFADIVNVLLFDGKQEVRSEELAQSGLRSQFKADSGRMHEEERDVAKYWMKNGRIAALIGLENQTEAKGAGFSGGSTARRRWPTGRAWAWASPFPGKSPRPRAAT